MPQILTSLDQLAALPFDSVIDVRSPSEFAEDHIPGAINLPVLSDEERARVGTIYVQQDRFLAGKIGAALVSRNAAAHLEGALAGRDGGWRPLLYCWRGGQRSGSFAAILREVGWRVDTIEGGYKAYRKLVSQALYDTPFAPPVVLVGGGTGTAKTDILHHLAAQGAQVLDLEGMAEHRGSLLGGMSGGQPTQKRFESRLAAAARALDPARAVFVEAESNRIGARVIPAALWSAMRAAPRIRITAPLGARARYLTRAYADLVEDPSALASGLAALARYHGKERSEAWQQMARNGAYADLAADLVVQHYDPKYARGAARVETPLATVALDDLDDASLADAASRIMDAARASFAI